MAKRILRAALLLFVLVAVATLGWRGLGAGPTPGSAPGSAATAASGMVAFYFHGNKRCTSCNEIERLTRAAYATDLEVGSLAFRSINVDQAEHAHFVADFQLATRTVVLAEEAGGKVTRFQRLDACWELFDDPVAFTAYLHKNLADFRSAKPATP